MKTDNSINPAKYSAEDVADYFIFLASKNNVEEGVAEGITPLKLQKMLYFAQAASLSVYNQNLFKENIEAWKYGPVISSLYHKYKKNLNSPITTPTGGYKSIVDDQAIEVLNGIWEIFGKYTAGELVEITHNHSPWKSTYEEGKNNVIPLEKMKDYYKDIFKLQSDVNVA